MTASQKVSVVTGASRDIGAELIEGVRQCGYRVVATSRWIAPTDDPNVDIVDPATARCVVSVGAARLVGPDTVANNAGILISTGFTSDTKQDHVVVTRVNLTGLIYITQLADLPIGQNEKQSNGDVVSITTSLTERADNNVPSVPVSLTKGALNAATKALAIERAKRGVRANPASPGVIKSPLHPLEIHSAPDALDPIVHVGWISDMVDDVLHLESPPFVTGEISHVDDGRNAGH
ncbi:SDR family oxidoreductase [Paraburkholderia sp. MMS20-SJTN17]|uniref:SDR family oxidoreductase n=1 Tax=Paraburkholderia translucens TaxID=2886945 RepID=A0ABS8KIQ3_9BURK|nr:SDR family oxidoreductase [Paraburkholderia sp. MMS20-SJTN17]MCC8404649.1 SDR family oxidoreductase [Paraburkholderia sp. MMS20-SJTN17]